MRMHKLMKLIDQWKQELRVSKVICNIITKTYRCKTIHMRIKQQEDSKVIITEEDFNNRLKKVVAEEETMLQLSIYNKLDKIIQCLRNLVID